ncbi:MAG: thioesterase [Ferruginibacter sp.]|nr:thioesterase [Ferruginibacter sp.]
MKKTTHLFCLPFAGGNKYSYREFVEKAPSFLNIITLEYPGRGNRMREPLPDDIDELTNDLYNQVIPLLGNENYAIYGHSLGGLMAYLLTIKLLGNGQKAPTHIFITGTTGPSALSRTEKKRYLLEKKEFIDEVRELDGMPDEILNNEELLYYFEPILRADFKISETYVYEEHPPLDIPFTVITGTQEDLELPDIQLWQKETNYPVDFKRMPGKHFFIFQHAFKIIEIISKKLYLHKTPS